MYGVACTLRVLNFLRGCDEVLSNIYLTGMLILFDCIKPDEVLCSISFVSSLST